MSLIHITRFSTTLQEHLKASVILPDVIPNKPLPTIWLLHGLGENGTCWERFTSIENLAMQYQVAVIMPNVNRSFYMDEASGLPYWTYLTEEFMPEIRHMFPLSTSREQNFVVGNSMGGFGALKLAFSHPEWFSAVAALSPAVDLRDIIPIMSDISRVFGPKLPESYLEDLALTAPKEQLQAMQWYRLIGDQDFMRVANDNFTSFMNSLDINETYSVTPGDHDWFFWDDEIKKVFAWLPLQANN